MAGIDKVFGSDEVRIPKAAEIVAHLLRRRVMTGEFTEGAMLPNETKLMASFNVGRSSVREALRILESEGLVVVRRGVQGGAEVRAPAVGSASRQVGFVLQYEGATLEDVLVAWVEVQVPAVRFLVERAAADAEVLLRLERVVRDEAGAVDSMGSLTLVEGRFHQAVMELAGNVTLRTLAAAVGHVVHRHVQRLAAPEPSRRPAPAFIAAHRSHQRLVRLVRDGDPQEVEKLWRRHLEAGARQLLATTDSSSIVDLVD